MLVADGVDTWEESRQVMHGSHVQALMRAVEEVASWKRPLQASLDSVDAELAELALSVPLAQVSTFSLCIATTVYGSHVNVFSVILPLLSAHNHSWLRAPSFAVYSI